jgi:fructose-1,6-bisphosphatase/inositol monophosphatase family enzyme
MVRMSGGSPAFALIEAAKGSFNYVNLWPVRPTEFYDLSADIMLIRGAGGKVVDLDGLPIKQKGPYETGLKRNLKES